MLVYQHGCCGPRFLHHRGDGESGALISSADVHLFQMTCIMPAPLGDALYLIASALGGEPTPPGTLSGAEVMKKSYRPSSAQSSARPSRFHISPIGIPKNASM